MRAVSTEDWLVHMALDTQTETLLDALDRAGMPWGIITNGPVQQRLKDPAARLTAPRALPVRLGGVRLP